MDEKKERLEKLLTQVVADLAREKDVSLPDDFCAQLERPRHEGHGDWATNTAMQLTKRFGMPPRDLASEIASRLRTVPGGDLIEKIEIAGPGFMNITLKSAWVADLIADILAKRDDFGRCNIAWGKKVQVEYVSANPTGPLHIGHARGAVVGDILSSVLEFCGWEVGREYYINDAGNQMELLGRSTQARYFALLGREAEAPFPEDGYQGDYLTDIAQSILDAQGKSLADKPLAETLPLFTDESYRQILATFRKDLGDFGVLFDVWFSERSLYDGDEVEKSIAALKERGFAYDQDGAVWFKSTHFGDDKDRVMIRANGVPTYFTSDVVYLKNKYDRGFDYLIYVWGADHHGYVPRMKSVNEAFGGKDEAFVVVLIQFVSLLRGGVPVAMSKRAGSYVTLREVLDEVGPDAMRFFLAMRRCDSHLDFDLELAKKSSSDNPVFYVQYAHARICSILREVAARGVAMPAITRLDVSVLTDPTEAALVKTLSRFPEEVAKAGTELAPHRMAFYAQELAESLHAFYNAQRILGVEEDVMNARLLLVEATRVVLRNVLRILGISAPEKM